MPAPSLLEQGRRLTQLQRQILAIREQAGERARKDRKHAAALQAQADAEIAPLLAEATALRDVVISRARKRARLAWYVVYAGVAAIVLLVLWQLR